MSSEADEKPVNPEVPHEVARRIVEITDEDEDLAFAFIPVDAVRDPQRSAAPSAKKWGAT
jgi:hypothetical protein